MAEGWLGLKAWEEAKKELEAIENEAQPNPRVLLAWWGLYAGEGRWSQAVKVGFRHCQALPQDPDVWALLAYSIHRGGQTEMAREMLFQVLPLFPKAHVIRWFLAIFASALGRIEERREWLKEAKKLLRGKGRTRVVRHQAELEALWGASQAGKRVRTKRLQR